jgi:8-oxo-dGTP diphosphatase
MSLRDGNGWVRCGLGHRHWGRFGAAGLLAFVAGGGPVLLQQRTWWSHHGGTWGLPGGARDSHETVLAAAEREAAEECGVRPGLVRPRGVFSDDHGGWSYTTVLAEAASTFEVQSDYDETEEVAWVDLAKIPQLGLHPGFAAHWDLLRAALTTMTLIVDGANVMGSRPDGWWRDRAGAASRLRGQLAPLVTAGVPALPGEIAVGEPGPFGEPGESAVSGGGRRAVLRMTWLPDIVLVVEGAARPAAAEAGTGQVRVLAAPGSGDDTIAELAAYTAGRRVVVTADRELQRRCLAAGAEIAGPGWLLGLIDR